MRILHAANFSWFSSKRKRVDNLARYYAMDRKITNGLIRNGHCVWDFSYRDAARYLSPMQLGKHLGAKKMNGYFLQIAKQFKPDVILLGHCEIISSETLATLRNLLPDCKIAQWWVDPFAPHSLAHLRGKQPYLDAFFATSAPIYYRELINTPNTPSYYLPNIVDSSMEIGRSFLVTNHQYDVFFAGSNAPERDSILQKIKKLPNIRCGFFGFNNALPLSGANYMQTTACSKIGINLSRATHIPLYTSDRMVQLAGNGCLVLSPHTPEMTALFDENEVVYYKDDNDLFSCITDYCKDDTRWRKIAEAGWQRAHASYNERRVTKFMLEAIFNENFSEQYEWITTSKRTLQ